MAKEEDWITTTDAAALSGYNEEYIRRLIRTRKIPARRFGPMWQLRQSALLAYMRTAQGSPDKRRGPRSPI